MTTLTLTDPLLDPCPLQPSWEGLLRSLLSLPSLWMRTGSRGATLQAPGRGGVLIWDEGSARILAPGLDLRMNPGAWATAEAGPDGVRIFDGRGEEALRFLLPAKALRELASRWRVDEACQRRAFLLPRPAPRAEAPNRGAFLRAWSELRDIRAFPGLLARFGLRRVEALHLAEGRFSQAASRASASLLLDIARARAVPLTLFVGNAGSVQIAAGVPEEVRHADGWTEAEGGAFTFRLHRNRVDRAWFVSKPTAAGLVRSLELFDGRGDLVVQLFAQRPEGAPEGPSWRALLEDLEVNL